MNTIIFTECSPSSLNTYLKGLGVFRIIASQADASATCHWDENDNFCINTKLTKDKLVTFLLETYSPSPILSPWNSESGFKKGNSTSTKNVKKILDTTDNRLEEYRQSIRIAGETIVSILKEIPDPKAEVKKAKPGKKMADDAIEVESEEEDDDLTEDVDGIEDEEQNDTFGEKEQGGENVEGNDKAKKNQYYVLEIDGKTYELHPSLLEALKNRIVIELRNKLPDRALLWIDTAVIMLSEELAYPPILGTGGNYGHLEIAPTFMEKICEVVIADQTKKPKARRYLLSALFSEGSVDLQVKTATQFDPGSIGGIRAGKAGKPKGLTNPWDWILSLEGSLFWASGVTRRLDNTGDKYSSMPFCFNNSPVGYSSESESEQLKKELWAPFWNAPFDLCAVEALFANGRISWRERQARSGLQAFLALSSMGVDAGIQGFTRNVIANRNGQSPIVVSTGKQMVKFNASLQPIGDLDFWISKFRQIATKKDTSLRMSKVLRNLEQAVINAAKGSQREMQDLLLAVFEAEYAASLNIKFCKNEGLNPVPWLSASKWLPSLDDGSVEFRIAASLCTMSDFSANNPDFICLRTMLTKSKVPVEHKKSDKIKAPRELTWQSDQAAPPVIVGLESKAIYTVLKDILILRSRPNSYIEQKEEHYEQSIGVEPWFPTSLNTLIGDAEKFVSGQVDINRLQQLLKAMIYLKPFVGSDFYKTIDNTESRAEVYANSAPSSKGEFKGKLPYQWKIVYNDLNTFSPLWRNLIPFYSKHNVISKNQPRLRPQSSWASLIESGNYRQLTSETSVRYRMAGYKPLLTELKNTSSEFRELLPGSLLISVPKNEVTNALNLMGRKIEKIEKLEPIIEGEN